MSQRKHYFLVAGEVTFEHPDHKGAPLTERLNAVFHQTGVNLPARSLGRAQQALQLNLHEKYKGQTSAPLEVTGLFILGITHLGLFDQGEFHAGMQDPNPTRS